MRRVTLLAVLLAIITLGVFSPVLKSEFLEIDDQPNIVQNTHVHELSAANLKWMFTDTSLMRRYVPFSWLMWGATAHVFGVKSSVFHLEGLVMHALNVLLLFLLLRRLLSQFSGIQTGTPDAKVDFSAATATLVWAVHPMRAEVVGWANCQMYSQTLFFGLLSLWFYLKAAETHTVNGLKVATFKSASFWLSVVCLAISLFTYPTMIGFGVVLLMIDIYFLKRLSSSPLQWKRRQGVLIEKIPFAIVTVVAAAVALAARMHMSAYWAATQDPTHFTGAHRAAQAFYIWAYYLWRPFWPVDLSPFYGRLLSFEPTEMVFVTSAFVVVVATIFLFLRRSKLSFFFALWMCHLALLVPMLGITENPYSASDRYNHIQSILFSALIAFALIRFWRSQGPRILATCLFSVSICGVLSFQQVQLWKTKITYTHTMVERVRKEGTKAALGWCSVEYNRLGDFFAQAGDTENALRQYIEAIHIEPRLSIAHDNIMALASKPAHMEKAMAFFETLLEREPQNALAHAMLAASFRVQQNRHAAMAHAEAAIKLAPDDGDANKVLGLLLAEMGQCDEAAPYLFKVSQLYSKSVSSLFDIGSAYFRCGRAEEAIEQFSAAVRIDPKFSSAQASLGGALAMVNRLDEALPHLREAARLRPNTTETLVPLAMALAQAGDKAESRSVFAQAVQLAKADGNTALVNQIRESEKTFEVEDATPH